MTVSPTGAVDTETGCVLFTDLVGFTEYNDTCGDEAALEILEWQTRLARVVVEDRDGARVVKELGDGLMLWFPSATVGLAGAVDLTSRVFEARRQGFPLAVRMGMHYGSTIRRGDDLVGQTVNIAARVADLAGPGEMLVSEDLLAAGGGALPPGFRLQPVGPVTVKGVSDPVWLHRLDRADRDAQPHSGDASLPR